MTPVRRPQSTFFSQCPTQRTQVPISPLRWSQCFESILPTAKSNHLETAVKHCRTVLKRSPQIWLIASIFPQQDWPRQLVMQWQENHGKFTSQERFYTKPTSIKKATKALHISAASEKYLTRQHYACGSDFFVSESSQSRFLWGWLCKCHTHPHSNPCPSRYVLSTCRFPTRASKKSFM